MKPEEVTPELLDWLKTTAEKTSDFVQQEAPLLAREIVDWYFWSSATFVVIFSALAAVSALAAWLAHCGVKKHTWTGRDGDDEPFFALGCLAYFGLPLLCVAFLTAGVAQNSYHAVKACVAPRLVVLEAVKGALK